MCNLNAVALHIRNIRKPDVRIVEHRENILRTCCKFSRCCKNTLLLCGKRMRTLSHDHIDRAAILLKLRLLLIKLCNPLFRDCQNLRIREAERSRHFHPHRFCFGCISLIMRIRRILMITLVRIHIHATH